LSRFCGPRLEKGIAPSPPLSALRVFYPHAHLGVDPARELLRNTIAHRLGPTEPLQIVHLDARVFHHIPRTKIVMRDHSVEVVNCLALVVVLAEAAVVPTRVLMISASRGHQQREHHGLIPA
jgi:hypothetical protein